MELKIYKSGQGYYTRLWTGIILFVIIAIGCWRLYQSLTGSNIWVQSMVPAGVCAVLGLVVFYLVNKPKIADFMISAEGEVKKVSWSSKNEIIASTIVVIVVVAILAVLLWVTDMLFQILFRYVFNIY